MISTLLTSPGRAWRWLSTKQRGAWAGRRALLRRRTVVAEAQGRTLLTDCQRHEGWWSGVVKVQDASQDRVVHVCTELRPSAQEALGDAEHDAQRLALMFAL